MQPNSKTNIEAPGSLINDFQENQPRNLAENSYLRSPHTKMGVEQLELNIQLLTIQPAAETSLHLIDLNNDLPIEDIPIMPALEEKPIASNTKTNRKRKKRLIVDKTIELCDGQFETLRNEVQTVTNNIITEKHLIDAMSKTIFKLSLHQQVSKSSSCLAYELQQTFQKNIKNTKSKPFDDSIFENIFGNDAINMILPFDKKSDRKRKESNQESSIAQDIRANVNITIADIEDSTAVESATQQDIIPILDNIIPQADIVTDEISNLDITNPER